MTTHRSQLIQGALKTATSHKPGLHFQIHKIEKKKTKGLVTWRVTLKTLEDHGFNSYLAIPFIRRSGKLFRLFHDGDMWWLLLV